MAAEQLIGLEVRGLREFQRALKKADRDLLKDVRGRLRGVATITAGQARVFAGARTHRGTGDLVRGIRPFVTLAGAGVRSGAMHRGYPYPKRLEFEDGGRRASLYPAYYKSLPLLLTAGEQVLSDIEKDLAR